MIPFRKNIFREFPRQRRYKFALKGLIYYKMGSAVVKNASSASSFIERRDPQYCQSFFRFGSACSDPVVYFIALVQVEALSKPSDV